MESAITENGSHRYFDIVDETDDEDIDANMIDDEDDSFDWEDFTEEGGNASIDDKFLFKRVDSRAHLATRQSLITIGLQQKCPASAVSQSTLVLQQSRTESPNRPSLAVSPESDDGSLLKKLDLRPVAETSRFESSPQLSTSTIPTNAQQHALASSPRTTRRRMLSAQLATSLQQHLLWECQEKSKTANAFLERGD